MNFGPCQVELHEMNRSWRAIQAGFVTEPQNWQDLQVDDLSMINQSSLLRIFQIHHERVYNLPSVGVTPTQCVKVTVSDKL